MKPTIFTILAVVFVSANACNVKDVKSESYTTTDGLIVTNVAHISTFSLSCDGGKSGQGLSLFAELPGCGKRVPVTRSVDGSTYEISWIEDLAKASSGDKLVKIYDEERYNKLIKSEEKVEPIATITVNHRGTYRGPLIPAEVFAVGLILVIYYLAQSAKSKLTS